MLRVIVPSRNYSTHRIASISMNRPGILTIPSRWHQGNPSNNVRPVRHFHDKRCHFSMLAQEYICTNCGQGCKSFGFTCASCGSLLDVDTTGVTHFMIMGLPETFTIEQSEVEAKYKALQRLLHPDKHASSGEQGIALAETHSARVNEAVSVLRSPLKRAAYWMQLNGVPVLEEDQRIQDMPTMMEVMETSEELETCRTQAQVNAMIERNALSIHGVETELSAAILAKDWPVAHRHVERLQMITRLRERLNEWVPT